MHLSILSFNWILLTILWVGVISILLMKDNETQRYSMACQIAQLSQHFWAPSLAFPPHMQPCCRIPLDPWWPYLWPWCLSIRIILGSIIEWICVFLSHSQDKDTVSIWLRFSWADSATSTFPFFFIKGNISLTITSQWGKKQN